MSGNNWRRPEDELPEDGQEVIALVKGNTAETCVLEHDINSFSGARHWILSGYGIIETPSVKAWRPLPDPPEWIEGGDE